MLEMKCSPSVYQTQSAFTRANQTNQDGYLANCTCECKHSFTVSEAPEFKHRVFSFPPRDVGVSQLEAPSVISGACQAAAPSGLPEILPLPGGCRAQSQQLTSPGFALCVVCTRVDAQCQAAGEKLLWLPKLLLFEAVQLLFLS